MASSAGDEAVELAATAGLILDDWQAWWLRHALSERADGDWAAKENVLITGRQSGKNGVLAALELAALDLLQDPLTIHSAHEVATSLNHFEMMCTLIENTPDLDRKVQKISNTNGRESIRFRNGCTLKFRARGKNSGRGLTAGRIVFDEAFAIPPSSMGALIPTMRAMRNAQITYASSAPKADSVVLHSLIRRGRADDPTDKLFYAEWGNPKGTAMDDVDAWYAANPALGIRVTEDNLRDEYRTLVAGGDEELIAEFSREAAGIGEDPEGPEGKPAKLPADKWAATAVEAMYPIQPGAISLAYDVSKDGEASAISVAAGDLTAPFVATIDDRAGVGWLPDELVRLVHKWDPIAVGVNAAGAAGGTVASILEAFRAADPPISADLLVPMSAGEYTRACGGFYTDVTEGRLTRLVDGVLDRAGSEAAERTIGTEGGWAWDRRSATVSIAPLVSATIARALLPTKAVQSADPDFIVI